jgi:hypothetical protein
MLRADYDKERNITSSDVEFLEGRDVEKERLRNDGGSSATGKSLPDFGEFICARRACCELIMTKNEISRLVTLSS